MGKTASRLCPPNVTINKVAVQLKACHLFVNHVPTIWAIDHYRKDPGLQNRSVRNIDGVKASVQLWDTFGDHEKDRKYAYQKANVALLCFNISSMKSYQHVRSKWFPEIREFCPNVPIILVGCKNDVRYLNQDPEYMQYWKEKLPYSKKIQEDNLISREQGRLMAREIGAVCYYETSAYTSYGVDFLYENIARLGLISRRKKQLFMKRWKSVNPPQIQEPYCPPKPSPPELRELPPSTYRKDIANLVDEDYGADFFFFVRPARFCVLRLILAATSEYFREMFFSLEDHYLNVNAAELPHLDNLGLELSQKILLYHYTGYLDMEQKDILVNYKDIKNIIELEELKDLIKSKDTVRFNSIREVIYERFLCQLKDGLLELGITHKIFADVVFEVDDGACYAHRGLLRARSDYMKSMFSEHFIERSLEVIQFPNATMEVLDIVLEYLYTDRIRYRLTFNCAFDVIILANRMCLFRLINIVESAMILLFNDMIANDLTISNIILDYLGVCKMHNAFQLYEFCCYHIVTNYHQISLFSADALESLGQDLQDELARCRWPPLEVHKENIFYEQFQRQTERQVRRFKKFALWRRARNSMRGLYGSMTSRRARIVDVSEPESDPEDRLKNQVPANDMELYQGSFGRNLCYFVDDSDEDQRNDLVNVVDNNMLSADAVDDLVLDMESLGVYGSVGPEIFV
ncbi:hypothetical protein JTE90_007957 [Oedothorax gibbosus]|uniref:BTB domain-containing protein n=1 Tax=Oedothorax gibbosus TaxID=931172 RepID=A0AAV6U7G5_9ARAC|nr:hypothetical protein JTE90_007957 [Oedothorax gibbosus]